MSDLPPDPGRSKPRQSRLGKKEFPVGKPVAPPPGWMSPTPPPSAPPLELPPPVSACQPPIAEVPPSSPPPTDPAPVTELPSQSAAPGRPFDPTVRPVMLSPKSEPIWSPVRDASPSAEMTYSLIDPPPSPMPTSYVSDPELLTPSARIGLALIGVVLLVGGGLFVFHDGFRKINAGSDTIIGSNDASPLEPPSTPAPLASREPEPVAERKEPAKNVEVKAVPEPKVEPKRAEKLPLKPPDAPPMPRPDPLRAAPIFEVDIWPIFQAKCIVCHGGRKKGGVDVRSVESLVGKGAEDGVLVRGSITKSRLWRAIDSDMMPKAGTKITVGEKEQIRRWIMAGAKSTPKTPPPQLPPHDEGSSGQP